jgi:DNA polymerase III subunit delta
MIYKSYQVEQNIKIIDKKFSLFFGENLGLKNEFKKQIKLDNKNAEIIAFTQDEILKNEDLFFNEINNISLFDEKKIFLVYEANDKILDIIKELEKKSDTQQIFLFSEILDKRSKIRSYFEKSKVCAAIPCYPDNEIGIKKIIINVLRGYIGLSPHNLNLIVESCNLDRVKLMNELNKILTLFQDKKIDTLKLESLLNVKINDDFNVLKDEALNGNKSRTNKLLSDTVIEPDKIIFYLAMLNQRLNKLSEISIESNNTNMENAINNIKPPIFWKDKANFITQAKKWGQKKTKFILDKTYNLEIEFKSNSMVNKSVLMKNLIVDICEFANS